MSKPALAVRRYLATLGRLGGRARAGKLTPAQRQAIARLGGLARWANEKERGGRR